MQAQEPSKGDPSVPLQQQIDALREGQARLQQQLDEIKGLLKAQSTRAETPVSAPAPSVTSVNVFGEPFRGEAKARVAIMEYSDFDCSFCARYATEIYPKIHAQYVKTGRVKYFFRDWPSSEHANALQKARLARCAGEQGQFWEAHDLLFAEQKTLNPNDLAPLIQRLGLDGPKFMACASSEAYSEVLKRSAATALRMRLRGTPAFLVGELSEDGSVLRVSKIFFGGESLEAFQQLLDGLLTPAKH
jgi:protein-disulfide isomerase